MIHGSRIDLGYRGQKIDTKLVSEFCKEAYRRGARVIYAMIEPELRPVYINSCNFKETGKWIEASVRLDG